MLSVVALKGGACRSPQAVRKRVSRGTGRCPPIGRTGLALLGLGSARFGSGKPASVGERL